MPGRRLIINKKKLASGFYRRRAKARSLAKVSSEVKTLKKFVMKTIENKQQNLNVQDAVILDIGYHSAPSLQLTQGPADGTGRPDDARIGNSITLVRSQLNMTLEKSTSGSSEVRARIMVVESVDGNQALAWEDILQVGQASGTLVGTASNTYTSNYTTKTDTNKRYKIHFDKVVTLNFYKNNNYFKNLRLGYGKTGKVIEYDGNNNTPTNHNLQILAISDQSTVGTGPKLSYSLRHTYKDA